MFGEPLESRTESLKNCAARTTTHRQSAIEKILRIPFHAQKMMILRMNAGIMRKADFISVLAIKQPAPNDLMTDIASLIHAYLTEENSCGT